MEGADQLREGGKVPIRVVFQDSGQRNTNKGYRNTKNCRLLTVSVTTASTSRPMVRPQRPPKVLTRKLFGSDKVTPLNSLCWWEDDCIDFHVFCLYCRQFWGCFMVLNREWCSVVLVLTLPRQLYAVMYFIVFRCHWIVHYEFPVAYDACGLSFLSNPELFQNALALRLSLQ